MHVWKRYLISNIFLRQLILKTKYNPKFIVRAQFSDAYAQLPLIAQQHYATTKLFYFPQYINTVISFYHVCLLVRTPALFVWQVSAAFVKYLNYPVNTRTVQHSAQVIVFPAVTFCNMNPVRRSAVDNNEGDLGKLFRVSLAIDISTTYSCLETRYITTNTWSFPTFLLLFEFSGPRMFIYDMQLRKGRGNIVF